MAVPAGGRQLASFLRASAERSDVLIIRVNYRVMIGLSSLVENRVKLS
jgi:hypothetical protein